MLNELVSNLVEAKAVLKEANVVADLAKKKVEEHEARLISYMDDEEITEFVYNDEFKIKRAEDLLPNVLVENHDKFKEWLGDRVSEVFSESPSKLKSFVKKLDKEVGVIPDFINVYRKQIVKVTKK
jgi:hypothetical protein